MIIIADSGSTKTDWRIIDELGHIHQAKSDGINPYYQASDEIVETLQEAKHSIQEAMSREPGAGNGVIHFYGAGCNSESKNLLVSNALKAVFGDVDTRVNTDLLAVARGLCHKDAGIACILGTGSNSCYFDGVEITHHIPPWGTWLGDEGSGSRLGRELVILYLNQELPDHLYQAFKKRYPNLIETVMDHVYRKPYPNRYLGQFSKFLFHHLKDPFVFELVYRNFQEFLNRKVLKYPNAQQVPVHVSGSIGYYFNTILRKAAADSGLQLRNITETPIAGLTLYHQQEIST